MRLILVRHGESWHGSSGIIAGMAGCRGLTPQGRQQIQALANHLHTSGEVNDCHTLLCSPWLRARQTADILAGVIPANTIVEDPGLCELQPGEADGLLWDDYRERYGNFDLVAEPRRAFAPGGESWTEFLHRVDSTLQRLSRQYDKELVVAVTHAGFIVASLLVLFDIPRPGTGARLEPLHAALTEWSVSDGIWQLVRFNHC